MSYPLDDEAREEQTRAERQRAKLAEIQARKDFQAVLALPEGRRVLWAFLRETGMDSSTFRLDPLAMAHAAGWRDAGNYWLGLTRLHCPEREAQMRNEARRDAQPEKSNDDE